VSSPGGYLVHESSIIDAAIIHQKEQQIRRACVGSGARINDIGCRHGIPNNVLKRPSFAGLSHRLVNKKSKFSGSVWHFGVARGLPFEVHPAKADGAPLPGVRQVRTSHAQQRCLESFWHEQSQFAASCIAAHERAFGTGKICLSATRKRTF
jgi:hypothetical protein